MKKKMICLILACVTLLYCLAACAPADKQPGTVTDNTATGNDQTLVGQNTSEPNAEPSTTVQIKVDTAVPQAVFASEEIMTALQEKNIALLESGAEWFISLEGIDESLGEQAYRVTVSDDKRISVMGGDTTGLMYGGLEVAEQIILSGGMAGVKAAAGSPHVMNRGIKFHPPLDMRTPTYSDYSDTAQNSIPAMWDMEFWKNQIDEMARARLNVLSLWSLNPFPSMVKVPEFPDVALDDVWRTTLPFDDTYKANATNLVRPEHFTNYEVVKKITIDEKIEFWRDVMQYAENRGVDFYIFSMNVYTYAENGKYGITSDLDNETTIEYYRASVREMIKTYPKLDGIGLTVGEQMYWETEKQEENEEWLWKTYGLGVNDALTEDPERDFRLIHRLHLTDFGVLKNIWGNLSGVMDVSTKYSYEYFYSSTKPTYSAPDFKALPSDMLMWAEVRNEDNYAYRWGDPDFVRDYFMNVPDKTQLKGFVMGSDDYVTGTEHNYKDSALQGRTYMEKHWFNYRLMGRLSYDPTLTNEFFVQTLQAHYKNISAEDNEKLSQAMSAAGKIIPEVRKLNYGGGIRNMTGNYNRYDSGGFVDISRWVKSKNTMQDEGVMSIVDYVSAVLENNTGTDLKTPPEVVLALQNYANTTLSLVEELLAAAPASFETIEEKDFYGTVRDQEAMALLGLYFAEKIDAAIDLRLFNETEDESYRTSSIQHLQTALEYWKRYAASYDSQYLPQRTCTGEFNPTAFIKYVEKDIELAQKWRIRRL